eukprot:752541-Hanusia_phi.AAC.5
MDNGDPQDKRILDRFSSRTGSRLVSARTPSSPPAAGLVIHPAEEKKRTSQYAGREGHLETPSQRNSARRAGRAGPCRTRPLACRSAQPAPPRGGRSWQSSDGHYHSMLFTVLQRCFFKSEGQPGTAGSGGSNGSDSTLLLLPYGTVRHQFRLTPGRKSSESVPYHPNSSSLSPSRVLAHGARSVSVPCPVTVRAPDDHFMISDSA